MPGGWSIDDDDLDEGSRRDAQNAALQAVRLSELIRQHVPDPKGFELTPEILCELNFLAVDGRTDNPGKLRTRDVEIIGSRHQPADSANVADLVGKMCEYVNGGGRTAMHLAAFVMWRTNWIHPFEEGNGRTARAASYLVLSVALGKELPGESTMIERCLAQKKRYISSLETADRILLEKQTIDVAELETFLQELLEAQLSEHIDQGS